jgi:hypothetical protein
MIKIKNEQGLCMVAHVCNTSKGRRIAVQSRPRQKHETLSEKKQNKLGIAQVVKCEVLSSNPSTAKRSKTNK